MFNESGLWNEVEKLKGGFDELMRATKRPSQSEGGETLRDETFTGTFEKAIPLPTEVDGEKIHAKFQDGVLTVRLPKLEKEKPRTVKID